MDAANEMSNAIAQDCGLETQKSTELSNSHEINLDKINFKYFTLEHVKCVVNTVADVINSNENAREWIGYHLELNESITRIIACGKINEMKNRVYVQNSFNQNSCP